MSETVDTPTQAVGDEATQAVAGADTVDAGYVEKLRKENARYRTEAKELAAKVAAFEADKQTESERLATEAKTAQEAAAKAQQELRAARAEAAIAKIAAKEQVEVELLTRLVTVEFDDDGSPIGVEAAAAKVLTAYPQLRPVAATPGATNPGRAGAAKLTMEDIKRMTPAQINERWSEVQAAMKAAGG